MKKWYVITAILAMLWLVSLGTCSAISSELDSTREELEQVKAELAELTGKPVTTPSDIHKRTANVHDYVEPDKPVIRNTAASAVADTPLGIASNSEPWKVWQINYWVYRNISYVSDPKGMEYYSPATETLQTGAGDCDDFAILLASMYESIGLDAAIAKIDTQGSEKANHMACLVYYSKDADSFLDEEKEIMEKMKKTSPTGEVHIRYINAATFSSLPKYNSGIWIFIDPPMGEVKDLVSYITHEPYDLVSVVDVGA